MDENGDRVYGITNPAKAWWIPKYVVTIEVLVASTGALIDRFVITVNNGYPFLSEYWLKGFACLDCEFDICFEAWFDAPGSSDICGYDKDCMQDVPVSARKKNPNDHNEKDEHRISANEENVILVFPNPSSGIYKFNYINKNIRLTVVDIQGNTVPFDYQKSGDEYSLNLSDQSSGIYILQILSDEGIEPIRKLLVKN